MAFLNADFRDFQGIPAVDENPDNAILMFTYAKLLETCFFYYRVAYEIHLGEKFPIPYVVVSIYFEIPGLHVTIDAAVQGQYPEYIFGSHHPLSFFVGHR